MTRPFGLAALATAAALALAACGSSSTSSTSGAGAAPAYGGGATAAPSGSTAASVVSTKTSSLGTFLVDGQGRALYLFEKDKGDKSTCSGACAAAWPPLTTSGKPTSGGTVQAGKLGTTTRSDGTHEVTYNGHPLYLYAGDSKAGQTTGQGLDQFGAEWYVLNGAGKKVEGGEDDSSSSNPYGY